MRKLLFCAVVLLAPAFGQVPSNGTYSIYNAAQTLAWDDPGFAKLSGTHVKVWPYNGGINQNWLLTSIGGGYYTIKNQASGLLLDDPGYSVTSGTQLVQWPSTGGRNQHWLFTPSGTGYTIKNQASGMLVDAVASTLIQKTANGSSDQNWHARKKSTYSISGKVGGSTANANLTLSGASSAATSTDSLGNYTFSNLINGTYVVAPSELGFTFSPTTAAKSVSGASISGVNFTATANTTHSVLLSVTDGDSGISGYRYYRSTTSGNSYALLNTSLAGNTYRDSTVVAGQDYYYVATAVNANGESKYSPQATSGVIP